jgi:bacteriophage HK97-gp10 putative tail-component
MPYTKASAPRTSKSGISIYADTKQLSVLARNLRIAAPEAWKACRVSLRAAGNVVASDARSRASYSSRIPASIKVRTTAGGNVKVVAGGPQAEDAAPLENKGRAGTFRHPVFGTDTWVEQKAQPFLAPALAAHESEVAQMIEDAVTAAVERAIDGGL